MKTANNYQAGLARIAILLIVAVIIVAGLVIAFSTYKSNDVGTATTTPDTIDQNNTGEPKPVIQSINPSSGPIGTAVTITGQNLSGFEGDLDIYFESADGKKIMLTDYVSYQVTAGSQIKVIVKEPCQEGEIVIGRYSGIESPCNFIPFKTGTYSVYVEPWGMRSNVVTFTVTDK